MLAEHPGNGIGNVALATAVGAHQGHPLAVADLQAQVLQKTGENSRLVTSGITVSYYFPNNTYSVGKTNFWTYANQTFGVALPANIGLTGKGLSGTMDLVGTHFEAKGVPLTEYTDQNPTTRQPFQNAIIVVTNSATGAELCRTQVVAPVSSVTAIVRS